MRAGLAACVLGSGTAARPTSASTPREAISGGGSGPHGRRRCFGTIFSSDPAHEVIRAVAAFANTVGGWVLIGVTNCKPNQKASRWADPENPPTLVDAVRDRLRHEIDPLAAFEAKVIEHPDGPVGVVRVYESSDTPHVVLRSGSVFAREVATVGDATAAKQSGSARHRERAYEVAVVRSRAQLLELAERGNRASERVDGLLAPSSRHIRSRRVSASGRRQTKARRRC